MAWALSPTPGSLPPSSLTVTNWQPGGSGLPADLFPACTLITVTLNKEETYRLSWTDEAKQECSMHLHWNGEKLHRTDVTINGPSGTIATCLGVTIYPDSDLADWDGKLTAKSNPNGEGNTGVFIAQASTGGGGNDPYGEPEDESGRSAGAGTSPQR